MISFWLLCWKLLRATTGFRRITPELTDGNHNSNHPSTSSTATHPENPVTMEMSSSPPVTDPVRDDLCNSNYQDVEELCCSEIHREEEEAATGDEHDHLVLKTEEESGGEAQGEGDGWRGVIEDENEGGWEVKGEEEEIEVPHEEKVEGEDGDKEELEIENLGEKKERADEWVTGMLEEIKQNSPSDLLFISDNPKYLLCQPPAVTSNPQEAALQKSWEWEDSGNRDDFSNDYLSDCLHANLAIVYPESDAEEDQLAALSPCDITSHIEESETMIDGRKEEGMIGEEVKTRVEEQEEGEGKGESREDEEEQSERDFTLQSPSVSSMTSPTDPDKRIPLDFCVQQETLSENVSTEHLDFLLARQQWKKMEEEVKGQPIPKPGLRAQESFQGTHSALYPPTRSPRLKHREIQPNVSGEPRLSSTLSPSSEDSGLDDFSYRSPLEEPESAVEREIRLTLEREERHRRERGMIAQGLTIPQQRTGRSPPRPPACRTPTLSISPSPSYSSSLPQSMYHEMTANNVIILEPNSSSFASKNRLFSSGTGGLSDWPTSLDTASSANVIVVETSNLIIRSASEFCLSSAPASVEMQESTFTSNPFFKLRSISNQSLVEQEIRMVRQREEEWRRQREEMWKKQKREEEWRRGRENYDTVLVSPALNDNISFNVPEVPDRSVSSPSSPSRPRKIERSSLSCDHKFPPSLSSVPQRQNTMAQRWEATLLANQKEE
ncbi:uncharacterized protein LOC108248242 isoform X2 [Kryptolebias marmoratus]|uniref:uncharacterized protein LOC108248242 isoform X2 n=1 Tax=Kryptolebias marmoratus TaxID=37003 RepID=UPI0007F8F81C|nr:uncharacterized protein LOC108248242 isoform X2 [Kryptolebias marmoratus]